MFSTKVAATSEWKVSLDMNAFLRTVLLTEHGMLGFIPVLHCQFSWGFQKNVIILMSHCWEWRAGRHATLHKAFLHINLETPVLSLPLELFHLKNSILMCICRANKKGFLKSAVVWIWAIWVILVWWLLFSQKHTWGEGPLNYGLLAVPFSFLEYCCWQTFS